MAGRPIKAGPRSTSSPAGLSHWPPRPPEVFPRACQGEQWAALRARGLVGERLIHPHTPCCLQPSPRPGRPSLPDASLRPAGRGPKMQRGAHPQASSGCLPCSEQVMMGGLSGSSRHVLPAAGGGEEGGESAGPAPPRRGTHDGGGSGTGGGARSGTCAHAARPAPPRSPACPAHWPDWPEAGAGWEESRGAGAGGSRRLSWRRRQPPRSVSVPPSRHAGLLGSRSLLPYRGAPRVAGARSTLHPQHLEAPSASPLARRRVA